MMRANVIGDLVLNDPQTECMSLLDQLAKCFKIAESILNLVKVDSVIAVIVGVWTPWLVAFIKAVPVVVPGTQPQCRNAEVLEIWQVIDDAAQITAVIRTQVCSV